MRAMDGQDSVRYDVVVVGCGAAGLSGALTLGRARRSVLVVDGGEPRNAPASGVHGFLTRDGVNPSALLEAGREEVRRYGADLLDGRVASAERVEDGFVVTLDDGGSGRRQAAARRHGAGRRAAGRAGSPGALGA
jgi:thioredoxin reductase